MERLSPSFPFLFLFAWLVPMVLFLLTQKNTLKRIHPHRRAIGPGAVWLKLIPLFGLIWQFVVVSRLATSLSRELAFQTTTFSFEKPSAAAATMPDERPTYKIGLAYCIFMCLIFVPMLNVLSTLAGLVCWVIYWVRLSQYKNQLQPASFT